MPLRLLLLLLPDMEPLPLPEEEEERGSHWQARPVGRGTTAISYTGWRRVCRPRLTSFSQPLQAEPYTPGGAVRVST